MIFKYFKYATFSILRYTWNISNSSVFYFIIYSYKQRLSTPLIFLCPMYNIINI